jgi:hypothetical protein
MYSDAKLMEHRKRVAQHKTWIAQIDEAGSRGSRNGKNI